MMGWREYNFDGIIGPTHNYAGLSFGNIASSVNAGQASAPRRAALQGLDKMRLLHGLGIGQGFFLPHNRPETDWLSRFGFTGTPAQMCAAAWREEPDLLLAASSASPMWAANAATVSASPDTADGRIHFTPANLSTMAHRSLEWPETQRQLRRIFPDPQHFAIHDPVPARYGDEGAANFMRIAPALELPGTEIMVYGSPRDAGFPARQSAEACRAIFRAHGVAGGLLAAQSTEAIDVGAFHNDVVAVATADLLFTHELAFADKATLFTALIDRHPDLRIVEVRDEDVPLSDAIASYLFNSQLLILPDRRRLIIVPVECAETLSVKRWLDAHIGGDHPISEVRFVDVRESMRNGGGPACLRLRVLVSPEAEAAINPLFVLTERRADQIAAVIERHWPERVTPADLGLPDFWAQGWEAVRALEAVCG
ncbi:MAG TPA: N-succinylarginine dihydrolase [Sphingobium sp.]|uniref:N-succinylarginine dihydrolase n=1 Tax=Sphingobium sp. TaxID=1912891 RepID=UPI002ECFD70B